MGALVVNDKNFETEVIQSKIPVLVDFWAEWCGPCRALTPIVEEVAVELQGKIKVVKINVDESQELSATHNIMSIPTLLIFKNGEPIDSIVGFMSKEQLLSKINSKIS